MLTRNPFKPKQIKRLPQTRNVLARAFNGGPVVRVPVSRAKENVGRNHHLLAMAQGMPCLLRSPACNGDSETVVAAHSNQSKHGKSMGKKASDAFVVYSCARCHQWLDTDYTATRAEKIAAFDAGHARQVAMWEMIASDPRESEADRKAAQWALDELCWVSMFEKFNAKGA